MVRHDGIPAALAQLEPTRDAGPELHIRVLGEPNACNCRNVVGLDSAGQDRIGQFRCSVALSNQELRHNVANRGGIAAPTGQQHPGDLGICKRRQSPGGGGSQFCFSVAVKDRLQRVSHLVERAALKGPHGENASFQSEIPVERLDSGAIHEVSEADVRCEGHGCGPDFLRIMRQQNLQPLRRRAVGQATTPAERESVRRSLENRSLPSRVAEYSLGRDQREQRRHLRGSVPSGDNSGEIP